MRLLAVFGAGRKCARLDAVGACASAKWTSAGISATILQLAIPRVFSNWRYCRAAERSCGQRTYC